MSVAKTQAEIDALFFDGPVFSDLAKEQAAYSGKRLHCFGLREVPDWGGSDGKRKPWNDTKATEKRTKEAPSVTDEVYSKDPWLAYGRIVFPGEPKYGWKTPPTLNAGREFYDDGGEPNPVPVVIVPTWPSLVAKYRWPFPDDVPWRASCIPSSNGKNASFSLIVEFAWDSYARIYRRAAGVGPKSITEDWHSYRSDD